MLNMIIMIVIIIKELRQIHINEPVKQYIKDPSGAKGITATLTTAITIAARKNSGIGWWLKKKKRSHRIREKPMLTAGEREETCGL